MTEFWWLVARIWCAWKNLGPKGYDGFGRRAKTTRRVHPLLVLEAEGLLVHCACNRMWGQFVPQRGDRVWFRQNKNGSLDSAVSQRIEGKRVGHKPFAGQ